MTIPHSAFRLWLGIALSACTPFATVGRSEPSSTVATGQFAGQMETEVREVLQSDQLPPSARERRIANIARMSVAKATKQGGSPADALETAVQLTEMAVRLAPEYADAIAGAVALAPVVARTENGAAQIRAAALAAAEAHSRPVSTARREPQPAVKAAKKKSPASNGRMETVEAVPNTTRVAESVEQADPDLPPELSLSLGDNTQFALTASVGVEHDDNIFLSEANEQGDTIIRITPGFSFGFGRTSLAHGSFSYRHSFVSYAGNHAPSVSLGASNAEVGYDNGRFSFVGSMSFQQLNQNNRETVDLGEPFIRRDIFNLSLGTETGLTAKTSLHTGLTLGSTSFKNRNLIGTLQTEVPLRFYFALTPKTSLSVGTSYRAVKPRGDNAGASSRDMFHNIGLRGTLAPKLTGELSVGYRTRKTGDNPGENLWGFDGSLNLELTPKSNLSLLLARDFDVGAQGESLQNGKYTLRFAANPTDQWSLGAALSYAASDYGPYTFIKSGFPQSTFRSDNYWEGSLLTSYLFTSWFTASADYSLRRNSSSVSTAEFSNNVINVNLGFTY